MPIPRSFINDGFMPLNQVRQPGKRRRLMIGSDGLTNTGKSEFMFSAPGPGIGIIIDRGLDPMLDNPNPPAARRPDDWAIKMIQIPLASQVNQKEAIAAWKDFYDWLMKACKNPDCVSIGYDGDSDSWELQRLAEFGRIAKVPSHLYDSVNFARRAMIARLADSGKTVIATNKLKEEYVEEFTDDGQPVKDSQGNTKRRKSGEYVRQGFSDHNYLWHIQIRHLYRAPQETVIQLGPMKGQIRKSAPQWGIRITKCKANTIHEGTELWGDKCNFKGLVQLVYPHVPLVEWGFKE